MGNDPLEELIRTLHPRQRPVMSQDLREGPPERPQQPQQFQEEELDHLALSVLELSNCAEWAVVKGLLNDKLEFYNGKFLQTANVKYQGAYYAMLDLHNTLASLVKRGQDVLRKEGDEYADD